MIACGIGPRASTFSTLAAGTRTATMPSGSRGTVRTAQPTIWV